MSLNEVIDRFVEIAVQSGADIEPIDHALWIDELEKKLPSRLPASLRSLVTRYQFAPFEIGGIRFFANAGSEDDDEMRVAIFRDPFISAATTANGFIQFARPADGNYDPICFDTSQHAQNREYPIVRLDHEAILIYRRIRKLQTIASSFYRFVVDVIKAGG
jgi:hypothetical protein